MRKDMPPTLIRVTQSRRTPETNAKHHIFSDSTGKECRYLRISTLFSCQYLILNFPHRVCTYENIDLLTIAHCFLIRYAHTGEPFSFDSPYGLCRGRCPHRPFGRAMPAPTNSITLPAANVGATIGRPHFPPHKNTARTIGAGRAVSFNYSASSSSSASAFSRARMDREMRLCSSSMSMILA